MDLTLSLAEFTFHGKGVYMFGKHLHLRSTGSQLLQVYCVDSHCRMVAWQVAMLFTHILIQPFHACLHLTAGLRVVFMSISAYSSNGLDIIFNIVLMVISTRSGV